MKIMRSRDEAVPLASRAAKQDALCHQCPVCATVHEVTAARAQFAYGKQLACSPDCEAERRRRIRTHYRNAPALVTSSFFSSAAGAEHSQQAGGKPAPLRLVAEGTPASGSQADGAILVAAERDSASRRLAPVNEHKTALSVTVESIDVLALRRAIFQAGGGSVGILKTTPVPRSTKVRVYVGMKVQALEPVMTAIMRSVGACEFGRVVRV